jgi:hypothetical protein
MPLRRAAMMIAERAHGDGTPDPEPAAPDVERLDRVLALAEVEVVSVSTW